MITILAAGETPIILKTILAGSVSFAGGALISYLIWQTALKRRKTRIVRESEIEAEVIKKDKILQAKEKFLQLKAEHEKYITEKNSRIAIIENRLKQKETMLSQKFEESHRAKNELEAIRENLNTQLSLVDKKNEELEKLHKQQVEQLEAISGLSGEEAKEQLIESLKEESKTSAMSYINEIMDEAKMTAGRNAKKVVIETIQRVATEVAIENSVTVFNIESDEIKGRIIGREGRNIRALEAATGGEIVVDDTPEPIILSL